MGRTIQVVLDTNAFLWWVGDRRRLSDKAREALEDASELGVPTIVCWEIAMLRAKKRIDAPNDLLGWLEGLLAGPRFRLLPLTLRAAVEANRLSRLGTSDPADTIVVATSIELSWPVVTSDTGIRRYPHVETIW